jgi:SAM-dependent methyltransferase
VSWDPALAPPTTAQHADNGWFDASRAHPARVYDYWLGGKDNFAADRRAGDQVAQQAPWVVAGARANRAFLRRAVTHLARLGVDQYLDIGSGLPTAANVHQIAARHRPGARVAYLDNDPVVLAHARALLARDRHTIAERGDARDPQAILTNPTVRAHLDLTRPVAVLFVAVLHFLTPEDDPAGVVAAVRDALAPGSFIVISHVADLPDQQQTAGRAEATRKAADLYADLAAPFTLRAPDQLADLFTGLDLIDPGLVGVHAWRPPRDRPLPPVPVIGGVGALPRCWE